MFVVAVSAVAAAVTVGPSVGATRNPLVRVQVPLDQSVHELLGGRLVEKVTCTRVCKITTTIYIRARLAERLGYEGVTGHPVAVGSKTLRLRAKTQTSVHVSLDAHAKKLLSKLDGTMQLLGQVTAETASPPSRRGTAEWITFLSR